MLLNVSLPQLLFLPPLLLLVSGLALFNFQTLFRFLSTSTHLPASLGPSLWAPQAAHLWMSTRVGVVVALQTSRAT
jgi:hypothetical protein